MTLKILVAEDSVTMRAVLQMTFAAEDAQVIAVETGDAAIDKAKEWNPDVVIVDTTLSPDGYEIAKAIKSSPSVGSTRVLLLSSHFAPFDDARARSSGIDEHVIKPFDTQHLIERVKRLALGSASLPPPARPIMPQSTPAPAIATKTPSEIPPDVEGFESRPSIVMTARPSEKSRVPAFAPSNPMHSRISGKVDSLTHATLNERVENLGLSPDQLAAITAISREVIEQVVWEVVPELAETLIREAIARLTEE